MSGPPSASAAAAAPAFWPRLLDSIARAETFQLGQEDVLADDLAVLLRKLAGLRDRVHSKAFAVLDLKGAFILAYRSAIMLRNFATLNYLATRKLLACYVVWHRASPGEMKSLKEQFLERTVFRQSKKPDRLIQRIVEAYAQKFEGGSKENAISVLQTKMTDVTLDHADSFRLGVKTCLSLVFAYAIISDLFCGEFAEEHWSSLMAKPAYETYRGLGLLLLVPFFWSLDLHLWGKGRVNYVYVFEFNPRKRLTDVQMYELALNGMLIFLINLYLFLMQEDYALLRWMHKITFPTALWVYFISSLILPLACPSRYVSSKWQDNRVMLRSLGEVLIAPFGRTRFLDTIVADVLTSTVKILIDFWHVFRWYVLHTYMFVLNLEEKPSFGVGGLWRTVSSDAVMVPLLSALPLFFRFLQSLREYVLTNEKKRHLLNALKYALAHTIVIAGTFHPTFSKSVGEWSWGRVIWLVSTVTSTLYTFIWDCKMDWGLWDPQHGWLRRQTLYGNNKWIYYFVMGSNLILRFSWTVTLTPFALFTERELYQHTVVPIITVLELYRRFQWCALRVEWEHVKHSAKGFQSTPMYFDNERERQERARNLGAQPSLLIEAGFMVIGLVVVGIVAAAF